MLDHKKELEIDLDRHIKEYEDAWEEFFKDKTEPTSEEESLKTTGIDG